MNFKYYERMFVCGQTQSGKSFFVKNGVLQHLQRFVVYDAIKREYGKLGVVVDSLPAFVHAVKQGVPRIIVQPRNNPLSVEQFNEFCRLFFILCRNTTLVVDELHFYCKSHDIPGWLNYILTIGEGEPKRQGFIGLTQQPNSVHNQAIAQSKHRVAFYIDEENARKKLYYSGFGEYAYKLGLLPPRHYFYFNGQDRIYRWCKPI